MRLTGICGTAPAEADSIALLHAAHDRGVTFFDTAEACGPRTNEVLVANDTPGP